MNENLANFNSWFKEPIHRLQQDSEAGFIIVMISLALLERYLREKSGVPENDGVNASFRLDFTKLFPSIGSDDRAKIFWEVCRHGLMHQATFKTRTRAGHDVTMSLRDECSLDIEYKYGSSGDEFIISPTKFSNRVIEIIENDFSTFEAPSSPTHPPSQISASGFSGHKR